MGMLRGAGGKGVDSRCHPPDDGRERHERPSGRCEVLRTGAFYEPICVDGDHVSGLFRYDPCSGRISRQHSEKISRSRTDIGRKKNLNPAS